MPDMPRFTDLFNIGRDEILSRNALLSKDVAEREGTDVNVLLAAMAAMADEVAGQLAYVAAGVYLDSAQKQQLDRYAFDRYGLVRRSAAGSVGAVTFSLPTPAAGAFTIPDSTQLQALDGNQFLTVGNNVFAAATSSLVVPVRSALAGSAQNEKAGQINSILGAVAGAPAGLSVTNTLATFGASDDEPDDDLRRRCRAFFVTARRGTKAAIEQGALSVPGCVRASAFEVLDAVGRPARLVLLAVADQYTEQFANYSVVPPAYETQSQQFAANVFAGLDEYRAMGIYVSVVVAQVILQGVLLSLTFQAGADVDYTATLAKAAVVNYVNALAPGEPFVPADLQQRLTAIPGLQITGDEVASPEGVVQPKPLQVIRTSLGAVACAVAGGSSQTVLVGTAADLYTRPVI